MSGANKSTNQTNKQNNKTNGSDKKNPDKPWLTLRWICLYIKMWYVQWNKILEFDRVLFMHYIVEMWIWKDKWDEINESLHCAFFSTFLVLKQYHI